MMTRKLFTTALSITALAPMARAGLSVSNGADQNGLRKIDFGYSGPGYNTIPDDAVSAATGRLSRASW